MSVRCTVSVSLSFPNCVLSPQFKRRCPLLIHNVDSTFVAVCASQRSEMVFAFVWSGRGMFHKAIAFGSTDQESENKPVVNKTWLRKAPLSKKKALIKRGIFRFVLDLNFLSHPGPPITRTLKSIFWRLTQGLRAGRSRVLWNSSTTTWHVVCYWHSWFPGNSFSTTLLILSFFPQRNVVFSF